MAIRRITHRFQRLRFHYFTCCFRMINSSAKQLDPCFKNPCLELQQYVETSVFQENQFSFDPSLDEMKQSQKLFMPDVKHEIKFLKAVVEPAAFPKHDLQEVTFIGRSNVGKSSLLRAIFAKVPGLVVKTSNIPGHTKTINFYQVGNALCLVDQPGYGFRQPEHFATSVEEYLKGRKNLQRTFLLVDGKVGFQRWDDVAVSMLEEFKIPYGLVLTKIDKAIPSQRLRNFLYLQQLQKKFMSPFCFYHPFMVSSVTGEGLAYLQAFIAYITGNLDVKNG